MACLPAKGAVLAVLVLSPLLVVAAFQIFSPVQLDHSLGLVDDFSQYWSAGRLNLSGGDPYSPAEVHALQRALKLTRGETNLDV